MKQRLLYLPLLAAVLLLALLAACGKKDPAAESTVSEADPALFRTEGFYLKTMDAPMIYLPSTGPCYMLDLSDEDYAVLADLETGDEIAVMIDIIEEIYPGNCYPKSVEFLKKGSEDNISAEEILRLQSMGCRIITAECPDGIPNYSLSITWGVDGCMRYDSAAGEFVKGTEKAPVQLTDAQRLTIWQLLAGMPYDAYPEEYLPNPDTDADPDEIMILSVTVGGSTHTVSTRGSAFFNIEDEGVKNGADTFREAFGKIVDLLEAMPEWQALPAPDEAGQMPQESSIIYSVGYGEDTAYRMSWDGTIIPKDARTPITDILTGEIICYTEVEYERPEGIPDETDYEFVEPIVYTTVYSPEGELLIDRGRFTCTQAVAGLLQTYRVENLPEGGYSWEAGLIDPFTGETFYPDALSVYELPERRALLLDADGGIIGIIDENAQMVCAAPWEESYRLYTVCGKYLIAFVEKDDMSRIQYYLLNDDLETIYRSENSDLALLNDADQPYLQEMTEDGSLQIIDPADGSVLYTTDLSILYFDGTYVIESDYTAVGPATYLRRIDNSWDSGAVDLALAVSETYDTAGSGLEAFLTKNGDEITVYSPEGEETCRLNVPGLVSCEYADGRLTVCTDSNGKGQYQYMLMDTLGNTLYTGDQNCYYLNELRDESGRRLAHRLWLCSCDGRNGSLQFSLIDENGNTVASGLRMVGTSSQEAVAVMKGPYIGLMDLTGRWIKKTSVYQIEILLIFLLDIVNN